MRIGPFENSYPCVWWDGQVADGRSVFACVDGDVLRLLDPLALDETLVELPIASLQIEWRPGEVAALITVRGSDQSLELAPPPLLAQLTAAKGVTKSVRPPSLWPWLAAATALTIVGAAVMPPLTQSLAEWIPTAAVTALQQSALTSVTRIEDNVEDSRVFGKILRRLGASNVEVRVIQSSQPNAFALPGRMLLVTEPLLCDARSPSELIGVFAHELGHFEHRHAEAGWLRSHLMRGLTRVPTVMTELSMSRSDERAADRFAAAALDKAGVSKRGLREFFSRQSTPAERGVVSLWSTHPSDEERLAAIGTDAIALEIGLGPVELAALRLRHCAPAASNAPKLPALPQTPRESLDTKGNARMASFDGQYYWSGDVDIAPLLGEWLELCIDGVHVELRGLKLVRGKEKGGLFLDSGCDRWSYFHRVPGLPQLGRGKRRIKVAENFDSDVPFRFLGREYQIVAKADGDSDATLVLRSGDREQALFVAGAGGPEYNDVVFAGDLDGDKRLDVILETLDDGRILYLSSAAQGDELVHAVVNAPPSKQPQADRDAEDDDGAGEKK